MYCNDWTSVFVFVNYKLYTCTIYDKYMMYWCIYMCICTVCMYIHVYVHYIHIHVHCIMCDYNSSTLCLYVNI